MVNNAGWTHRNRPLLKVSEAEFDKVYAVNVKSIYHMTQAVVPLMRRQGGGYIIDMGSTAAVRPRRSTDLIQRLQRRRASVVALDGE